MRHVVVMVTSSYPRFPGDGVGSFIEPIAKHVAALDHEVHIVAPWHPAITRGRTEDGVFFHFYRYALTPSMNVFGYAEGLKADTHLRLAAWAAAPAALAAGWFKAWRVATKRHATMMHAHWVIPGGVTAALAAGRLPLAVSLHGSDVYVAERHRAVGIAAGRVFDRAGYVSACSDDLARRALALGARPEQVETVPYGVDVQRFAPLGPERTPVRQAVIGNHGPLIFTAGRLVRKKGFEVLIDSAAALKSEWPNLRVVIAGEGDLRDELLARVRPLAGTVQLIGNQSQDEIARLAAAADVVAVPSVRDDEGNVDGLPNFALEALATGTPVVASRVGGLPGVIEDGVTGRLVDDRHAPGLAAAIGDLLRAPEAGARMGQAARDRVSREFGWDRVARTLVAGYERARMRR
jgi:glycosyltransferase involved in cell wall biosynthesis